MSQHSITWREMEVSGTQSPKHLPRLSVVIPCYQKAGIFARILEKNAEYFQRSEIEIVVMIDDPHEHQSMRSLLERYPEINWSAFCHETPHEWRNPAPVLNAGVQRAAGEWVLVVSPESELCGDVPALFFSRVRSFNATHTHERCAFYGTVRFLSEEEPADTLRHALDYGSIFFRKVDWEFVCGYPEEKTSWGKDDDHFRERLIEAGVTLVRCPEILLLHRESPEALEKRLDQMFHLGHCSSPWEKRVNERKAQSRRIARA